MHRLSKNVVTLVVISLLVAALSACDPRTGGTNGGDKGEAAATVNGKPIYLSEVDRLISIQAGGQQDKMSPLQQMEARLQVLDNLIKQEVMVQRAEKEKTLPNEEEMNSAMNEAKRGLTEEAWQKALQEQGETVESFRDKIRKSLAVNKLVDKYTANIKIQDREVEDFYNTNKQVFIKGRGAEIASIVVDARDNGLQQDDAKSDADAKAKIDRIYTQLKSGGDFAQLARENSEEPNTRAQGGDMGFLTEQQMQQGLPAPLVQQLMGTLETGNFTAPVQNGSVWYIFKLKRRQTTNENLTLTTPGFREQLTEDLRNQRRQAISGALLEVAINESRVDNLVAKKMIENPNNFGSSRFAGADANGNAAATPANANAATTVTPTATPANTNSNPANANATAKPSPTARTNK